MATYRVARKGDGEAIRAVTNEAFMADAFFKLPEYHERFATGDVEIRMGAASAVFIVATKEGDDGVIQGSLFLEWEESSDGHLTGHFSCVSVHPLLEKRGIGHGLVKAAEEHLLSQAAATTSAVTLEAGIINLRQDLVAWYEKQGFTVGARLPHTDELARICLPDVEVHLVQISKTLR